MKYSKESSGRDLLIAAILIIVLAFGLAFLLAWPLMWAWNGSVHEIFGWVAIDYWMAFKLQLLFTLLCAGFKAS